MKKSRKYQPTMLQNALGAAVLVITIIMVLFGGASAITRENITAHLNRFANFVSTTATEHGKEARFTYGDVSIEGWGRHKQGEVKNVSFEIAEKALLDTTKRSFSTARMGVMPDPGIDGRMYFVFSDPINVIENSQLLTTIAPSGPIKYGYYEGTEKQRPVVIHTLSLPQHLVFTPGGEGDHGNRTILTYDENPTLRAKYYPETKNNEIVYKLHNVRAVSDDGIELNVGGIVGESTDGITADNHFTGLYKWELTDITVHDGKKSIKPFNVKADMEYSGEKPSMDIKALVPMLGGNSELTVRNFTISQPEFYVTSHGKIATAPDDPLPFGTLDIEIDNAGLMIASDLVPAMAKSPLAAALKKISGQSIDPKSHVTIALKREKKGVFYIGNVTFEELTATLLKNAFSDAAAPVLPPPPEPSDAPTEPAKPEAAAKKPATPESVLPPHPASPLSPAAITPPAAPSESHTAPVSPASPVAPAVTTEPADPDMPDAVAPEEGEGLPDKPKLKSDNPPAKSEM